MIFISTNSNLDWTRSTIKIIIILGHKGASIVTGMACLGKTEMNDASRQAGENGHRRRIVGQLLPSSGIGKPRTMSSLARVACGYGTGHE